MAACLGTLRKLEQCLTRFKKDKRPKGTMYDPDHCTPLMVFWTVSAIMKRPKSAYSRKSYLSVKGASPRAEVPSTE